MAREIVFDTETTGLSPREGHRIVEIGMVELSDRYPTGATFHRYLDPQRDVPEEAARVHGLTTQRLKGEARFADVVDEMLAFIGDDTPLVAHNAGFDLAFLNSELERARKKPINPNRIVDTLAIARRKTPAGPNSLDALCSRYGIDNSRREKHGALLDAEILADVYVELLGGRQTALALGALPEVGADGAPLPVRARPMPLPVRLTPDEAAAHAAFIAELGVGAIWLQYLKDGRATRG